jgi:tetratricopeptide (TPR) repeat protein
MSTYKKRGSKKSKIFSDKEDSIKSSATAEVFESLDTGASKAENLVAKYQNYIILFISLVTISALGYLGYVSYIFEPSKNEANSELNQSQYYFNLALNELDSPAVSDSLFLIALEGGDGRYGFLDIISNYSGTPAAEIAEYSAGMIYIKLKKYEEAISYLEKFDSNDVLLSSIAFGSIADSYLNLNKPKISLEYYEKALSLNSNSFSTPKYLFKAAVISNSLNLNQKALTYFKRIVNEFPNSSNKSLADIQIGRIENYK